jgi:murein DD-endopeptidase MepM/ murein hydrolase activator NlpD
MRKPIRGATRAACVSIFLLALPAAAATQEDVRHTIRPGQTLFAIARRYGVSLQAIVAANGIINPSHVEAGMNLIIPGAMPPPPPSTIKQAPRTSHTSKRTVALPAPLPEPPPAHPDVRALPWPVGGVVISAWGTPRRNHLHRGIDIGAPEGTAIHSVDDGMVVMSFEDYGSFGKLVAIRHDDGIITYYGHNSRNLVREGDRVRAGDVIAQVGRTGNATCSHVHFEVHVGGQAVDPMLALGVVPVQEQSDPESEDPALPDDNPPAPQSL